MVSTRRFMKGKKIVVPEGRDLPSELHNYAPRKYGDWQASYEEYKFKSKSKPNTNTNQLARFVRRDRKMGYVQRLLKRQACLPNNIPSSPLLSLKIC